MKLPFTDKFLWEMYDLLGKGGDLYYFIAPRTMKEACCPELRRLRYKYNKKQSKEHFSQFIYYLKKKGYIKIKNLENKKGVLLTKRGVKKALRAKFKTKGREKRKDEKWQMVIFDVPEKKRKARDLFRENLNFLGYKMLQQSVWVSPYDVLKETETMIRENNLDSYVKIFLIEEIEI